MDNRLSKDPENIFRDQFTDWFDYLSIQRIYYDLDTCKQRVRELTQELTQELTYNMALACEKLCKIDTNFPPNGLWTDYYKIPDLSDIINIIVPQKKKLSEF